MDFIGPVILLCALLHTFSVQKFQKWGNSFPEGSFRENIFHLLGEVEAVFGIWAGIYLGCLTLKSGAAVTLQFLETLHFSEPAFVFFIVCLCSTQPIVGFAEMLILKLVSRLPFQRTLCFYLVCLVVGPLMGSLITEPAAMTVTALILMQRFYSSEVSEKLKYATIGLLFVNISIGGTLTPFAAPPILMVARTWGWDLTFMLTHFGWKAVLAVTLSTAVVAFRFREEISSINIEEKEGERLKCPVWVTGLHLVFLALIVSTSHVIVLCAGVFLLFLSVYSVTKEYHTALRFREGAMVAFFLGGLVVLAPPQRWWLEPLIASMNALPLYLGVATLTAITDNAALTYLASQVPSLSEGSRYAIVAGAMVGGGLTVIANAPNPAGYAILSSAFGKDGISPWRLFLGASFPTIIAALSFWFL